MADPAASRFCTAGVAREQNHAGAMVGENFGQGFADAHRSAGDDGNFSAQVCCVLSHPELVCLLPEPSQAPGVYNRHRSLMASLLPLFPLDAVLLPGAPLPLHIFESRYQEMIAECLEL